ncbi:MAG: type IX secretion system outer membrane channel protein PorV [Bacteroidetes bacterium]|nr:type IX secretion system outer membrane channel protein PorV [Bacteroidota bacterium]
MQKIKIYVFFLLICVSVTERSYAQGTVISDRMVITTAVPFLLIAPDARSGGMGDGGVASSPDVYSMFWNPAKYAFVDKQFGVGIGYVPWLHGLVNDIGLSSVAGFWKIGDKQAVAASLRFFSMGSVTFTDENGKELGDVKPNEWAIDATYSRKFSKEFSGAVAGRFIYSNLVPVKLGSQTENTRAGTSVAADVALYYHHDMEISGLTGASINFGLDISNIGAKISYSTTSTKRDFLPTNLRLGPSFIMDIDDYNRLMLEVDLNKLLVPTPPIRQGDTLIVKGMDNNVQVVQGMIQSFYDAPGGFSEEIAEINIAASVEYWYNKLFSIRAGYFNESNSKGGRKFFTLGTGIRYNVFGLDFSYLIPVASNNPLQNTMQFTLIFNFDQASKQDKEKSTK